jgi:hypothetical protein
LNARDEVLTLYRNGAAETLQNFNETVDIYR